jgi:hypothetical protein
MLALAYCDSCCSLCTVPEYGSRNKVHDTAAATDQILQPILY